MFGQGNFAIFGSKKDESRQDSDSSLILERSFNRPKGPLHYIAFLIGGVLCGSILMQFAILLTSLR